MGKILSTDLTLNFTHNGCYRLTHNSPKLLKCIPAEERLEGFSPLKYEILSFEKCLNYQVSRGVYFLNCGYPELKRSSKMNFSVSEQHRSAVVG